MTGWKNSASPTLGTTIVGRKARCSWCPDHCIEPWGTRAGRRVVVRKVGTSLMQIPAPAHQLTPDDIDAYERRAKLKLPSEYREFLLRSNGGKPEPAFFTFLRNG